MDFSDEDVSASSGEEEFIDEEFADVDGSDGEKDSDGGAAPSTAAAAVAAAGTKTPAAAGTPKDVKDALLSGEMSAQAALLQLEVSELLSETALCRQPGKQATVQAAVQVLRNTLSRLPEAQVQAATAAAGAGSLHGLIHQLGPDAQAVSLHVLPPVSVQLVGSWALGAAADLSGCQSVDVAVQLPSSCLHHKDHLNYRYHAKRLLYLHQVSQHLSAHPAFSSAQQQLSALQGDPYRPVLLLQLGPETLQQLLEQQQQVKGAKKTAAAAAAASAFKGSTGLVLRLLPAIGLDTFEVSKLAPDRNNVRWVTGPPTSSQGKAAAAAAVTQEQQLLPTPHYNAAIMHDMLLLLNHHRQQQAVAAAAAGPKLIDTSLLLKVWAHQHGLSCQGVLPAADYACYDQQQQQQRQAGSSAGSTPAAAAAAVQADGFSGFFLAALLTAALQQAGAAAAAMSPLQQLRYVLQLLADRASWAKGGLSLARDSSVPVEMRLLHEQEQQQQQPAEAAAAAAVPGKVSKDQVKLQQKLQQQLQQLPPPAAAAAVFKKHYDVTFLDASGHLNLAASVSSSLLQMAQAAAQRSLAVLNRQDLDPDVIFSAVFRPGQGLAQALDYWWSVELPEAPGSSGGGSNGSNSWQQPQQQQAAGDQHPMRCVEVQVEGLIRAALGSRARLVRAIRRNPSMTAPTAATAAANGTAAAADAAHGKLHKKKKARLTAAAAAAAGGGGSNAVVAATAVAAAAAAGAVVGVPRRIVVGAVVDPVAALRLVDVGPAADDAAAAGRFRKLWGDKSELRRFQDGKICEAVVWEGVPPGDRHRIPDMAVAHVLLHHLPGGTVVQSCAAGLDPLLYASSSSSGSSGSSSTADAVLDNMSWTVVASNAGSKPAAAGSSSGTSSSVSAVIGGSSGAAAAAETAASRAADSALDSLSKQLRALSDVALKVIGVQPLSSVSRHTCCFYPKPHPLAEGSGARAYTPGAKVPRVLEAIDVMVQLESTGKMPLDPVAFIKTKAALGVQLASALAAASGAHVTASEEALEVLWQGFAFKLILFIDRDAAVAAAAAPASSSSSSHPPLPLVLSRHHGLVSALEAAHAAYGPTVRLAKRWLGAQLMLGSQLCEEAVELLVGSLFQGPSTRGPPASRISGMLSFLELLAHHPWSAAPLLVDPSGEVSQEARRSLQAEFEGRRAAGTTPGIFIASPYDLHSSRWTAHHPSAPVTSHLVSLARTALQSLSQLLLLGPDAPAVRQQLLAILQQQQQQPDSLSRKDSKKRQADQQSQANGVIPELPLRNHGHGLSHLEMQALGRAWRLLPAPALAGFDAWLVLRKEALPFADREDPLADQQLRVLLLPQQQQRRRLAAGAGSSSSSGGQQQQVALQVLLSGKAAVKCEAPKNARAILRSIPQQVLLSKPAEKLRSELLVGFDPVQHYLSLVAQRYGHMAAFCADSSSGFPAIGIKWLPAAFVPAPLRPALAHGRLELGVTTAAAAAAQSGKSKGGKGGSGGGASGSLRGLLVPNVPQVLAELAELGLGLVEEVVLL